MTVNEPRKPTARPKGSSPQRKRPTARRPAVKPEPPEETSDSDKNPASARHRRNAHIIGWSIGILAVAVPVLWWNFGDGVRIEASSLERSLDSDLFENAETTVERTGEAYFRPRPRQIMSFEADLMADADPIEVGTHLEDLGERHNLLPDIHVDNDTTIRAFKDVYARSETPELSARAWADIIRIARDYEVRDVAVGQSSSDPTTQSLSLSDATRVYGGALDLLSSWENLEAPEGIDYLRGRVEAGVPGDPLDRWEDGTAMGVPPVQISAPLDLDEDLPVRNLLNIATAEEAFGHLDEFHYQLNPENDSLCVELRVSAARDLPEDPPPELVAAAEDFASEVEANAPTDVEIFIASRFDTRNDALLHREPKDASPCFYE